MIWGARAVATVPLLGLVGVMGGVAVPVSPVPGRLPPQAARPGSTTAAQVCVLRLPLDVRIGQTMLVITGDPSGARERLDRGLIAGMLGTGILSNGQARAFQTATKDAKYGAILAADEEGGLVQRYRNVAGEIPSAAYQARSMTPKQVQAMYAKHGARLADWGVNMVFAPVADVGGGPGIGTRAYSASAKTVATYAVAAAAGYRQAGLLPVAKHFPGHGRVSGDTHDAIAVGPPLASLRKVDFVPFRAVIKAAPKPLPGKQTAPSDPRLGVMVGHTEIPGFSDKPSTQSKAVITGLLRKQLGFSGLIVSDALGMAGSGTSDQGQALVGFLRAGGDVGIVGLGGSVAGRKAVQAALKSGKLSEVQLDRSASRVFAAKGIDPCKLAPAAPTTPQPEDDSATPSDAPIVNPTKDS